MVKVKKPLCKARAFERAVNALTGQNIRKYRKAQGISQTALGEALGVSFQQIQKYERSANRISAGQLVKVSEVLGVSVLQLLPAKATDRAHGFHTEILHHANRLDEQQAAALLRILEAMTDTPEARYSSPPLSQAAIVSAS